MLSPEEKSKVLRRLKRIAGQVDGVQQMIESDRYCIDVLTQVSAARAALNQVSKLMLASHIQTCVRTAFESDNEQQRQQKMDELTRVFAKNCNC